MKKERLIELLKARGWVSDRWGHLTKAKTAKNRTTGETHLRLYRVKMQATSCRYEVKSNGSWIRVGGDYFKHCLEYADGSFTLGTILFPAIKD